MSATNDSDHDEVVELFRQRAVVPGLVVDEGGIIADDVFPSVSERTAQLDAALREVIHARDERIPVATLSQGIEFFLSRTWH